MPPFIDDPAGPFSFLGTRGVQLSRLTELLSADTAEDEAVKAFLSLRTVGTCAGRATLGAYR